MNNNIHVQTVGNQTYTRIISGRGTVCIKVVTRKDDVNPRSLEECWYSPDDKWFDFGGCPNKIVRVYEPENKVYSYWYDCDGMINKKIVTDVIEEIPPAENKERWARTVGNIKLLQELQKADISATLPAEILNNVGLILPSNVLRRRVGKEGLELQCGKLWQTDILVLLSATYSTINIDGTHIRNIDEFVPQSCIRNGSASITTIDGRIPLKADNNVDGGYVAVFGWTGGIDIEFTRVWKIMRKTRTIGAGASYSIAPYVAPAPWTPPEHELPRDILISYPLGSRLLAFKLGNTRLLPGMNGGLYIDNNGQPMVHLQ